VQKLSTDIVRGPSIVEEAVVALADANRETELAALIAKRADLDQAVVTKALSAERVEATAAVCRIANLPPNSYSAVLRMRARKSPSQSRALPILLAAYRQTATASPGELAELLRANGCET
jgi:hypothetical protein